MENPNDENILQDADYSQKTDFSKGEVVRLQVNKCNEVRSKEMRESYFNYDKFGNRVYIPDARREFISAVKALKNLLAPEIQRSEKFQAREKEIKAEELKIFNKWAIFPMDVSDRKIVVLAKEKRFIPELDQAFPQLCLRKEHGMTISSTTYVHGVYNNNFHCYWNEIVDVYDNLFAELNILVDENDYFKKGSGF